MAKNELTTGQGAIALNDTFNFEGISLGIFLKKNKMGKFIVADTGDIIGDELTVRITAGQPVYTLWRDADIEGEGKAKLYIDTRDRKEALELFNQLGLAELGYDINKDLKEGMDLTMEDVNNGNIFAMRLTKSGKNAFTKYAKLIITGLAGNESRKISEVVTKISTEEAKAGSFSWIVEKFEYIKG